MERREKAAFNIPGYSDDNSSYTSDLDNVYRRPEDRFLRTTYKAIHVLLHQSL
jgi:hypothetical protein